MSEAKHTQGPWSFDPEDKSIVGQDEGLSIATIDNIDVGGDKGFRFGEESKANARLMATAPELLEALRDMVSDRECLSEATLNFARAAIAKATSQST